MAKKPAAKKPKKDSVPEEKPEVIKQIEADNKLEPPDPPSPTVLTAASITRNPNTNEVERVCKEAIEGAVIVVNSESLIPIVQKLRWDVSVRLKESQTVPAVWRVPKFR